MKDPISISLVAANLMSTDVQAQTRFDGSEASWWSLPGNRQRFSIVGEAMPDLVLLEQQGPH